MKGLRSIFSAIVVMALVVPAGLAKAQMSSSNYSVPSDVFSAGGGDTSASANYRVQDTYGQTADGVSASANYAGKQGYRVSAPGILDAAFVDAAGGNIAAPTVSMSAPAGTLASGTLGISGSKLRVTNTRDVAPWSLAIAATGGPTARWNAASATLRYNGSSDEALTVNPGAATLAPAPGCSSVGLIAGPSATYSQGVVDSITLFTADGTAQTGCDWDITGIGLSQAIPQGQQTGSYSLSMTITVS